MRADSVGAPVTPQQWDYIHEMGGALRQSLDNVTAVFAPACIGHSVLTKRDWQNIKIDDVSLTDSLRCWENSLTKDRKIMLKLNDNKNPKQNKKHNKKKNQQNDQPQLTKEEREQRRKERRRQQRLKMMTPEEREQKKLERRERRRQERLLQKQEAKNQTPRAQRSPQEIEINNKNVLPKIIENEPAVKQQQKKRRQQANHRRRVERLEARNATRLPKHHKRNQQQKLNTKNPNKRRHGEHNRHKLLKAQNQLVEIKEPKKCGLRMLERCSWPQCNHSCPTLTNPLTGEEMKFLELLTSFGLDMDAVAQALGVDMQTLNNMDHRELIKLFTESAS
jgi:O-palmitoleoyl-L-serine hydrolase